MPKKTSEAALLERAKRAIVMRRVKQGLKLLGDLLATSVDREMLRSALLERGNCLLVLKRFKECYVDYARLIEFDEALGCQSIANAFRHDGEWARAIGYYTRAMELWKKRPHAKNAVAQFQFFRGTCSEKLGDEAASARDFLDYLQGMATWHLENNTAVFESIANGTLKLVDPGRTLQEELCRAEEVRSGGQMPFVAAAEDIKKMKKVIADVESGVALGYINDGLREYRQGSYKKAIVAWDMTGIRFDLLVKHAREMAKQGKAN